MTLYRLLTIEDNQNITDLICRTATEAGFDACSANGATASNIYDSFRPHVIVLDLLMPDMDGLEFLQFLKKQDSKAHIIILSGSSNSYRKIAVNLGTSSGLIIEATIPKPFRISEVRAVLEKIKTSLNFPSKPKRQQNA